MGWYDLYFIVYGRGDMTDAQVDQAVQKGRITAAEAEQIKAQNNERSAE